MSDTPWHKSIYLLLSDPTRPALWMWEQESGWSLPSLETDEWLWVSQVGQIATLVREAWGLSLLILRCALFEPDEATRRAQLIYEVLLHDPTVPLPHGEWVPWERIPSLTLSHPDHRDTLEQHRAEQQSGLLPPLRSAWARPGWFEEAAGWMRSGLERLGYRLLAPVEQVKSWGISCILRVRTDQGDIYFKVASTLPLFCDEPALTSALSTLYPDLVPTPLLIEPERGWMLLADFGPSLRDNRDSQAWSETVRLLGQLQLAAADQLEVLFEAGCLDRRLERLVAHLLELLDDEMFHEQVEQSEVAQLRGLAPRLIEMCGQLADYAIPPTLVHGDFHPGNVAVQEGHYLFFDWTDASIAHPFFDLITLKGEASELDDGAPGWTALCDSYLALWERYELPPRLQEAWALAEPLAMLHQVVSYHHIVATLEPSAKEEMRGGLHYWLRELLRAMTPLREEKDG